MQGLFIKYWKLADIFCESVYIFKENDVSRIYMS